MPNYNYTGADGQYYSNGQYYTSSNGATYASSSSSRSSSEDKYRRREEPTPKPRPQPQPRPLISYDTQTRGNAEYPPRRKDQDSRYHP